MKRLSLIAVAVSVVINAGALGLIASGIEESSLPHGQVVVTELGGDAPLSDPLLRVAGEG
jgi:hypothetical protein